MKKSLRIVCCTTFFSENWNWFASELDEDLSNWHFFHNQPRGLLEKYIQQPDLAMIRSCRQAAHCALNSHADLLITHDPRVSFWCAFFATRLGVQAEHIAYSFNFPELPRGVKRRLMTRAFASISQFIVYSTLEKQLYSDYFGIPSERIEVSLWSAGVPEVQPEEPLEAGDYICAIGGNARDYQTLMAAMEKLPDIRLVLVVRPNNLKNLNIPPGVKVLVNLSRGQAMNILKYSRFMVLPLKGSEVPCGHVTLVLAMHLGKAFIITNSRGVSDYVFHNHNAITCEPFAPEALAEAIQNLWNDPNKCKQLGENGRQFAEEHCSEESARANLQHWLLRKKELSS